MIIWLEKQKSEIENLISDCEHYHDCAICYKRKECDVIYKLIIKDEPTREIIEGPQ